MQNARSQQGELPMALSNTTQDHETIRKWAEARGAQPAEVAKTHTRNEPGILRFCFPNAPNRNDQNLREISWDEFFQKFDENNLEFVYQEETAEGQRSTFNKLVHPTDEEHSSRTHASLHKSESTSAKSKSSHGKSDHKSRAA
jgi:hypothetical protein